LTDSSFYKGKYFDFNVVDNWLIIVDYSEMIGKNQFIYDFDLMKFPDSPPDQAVCVIVSVRARNTFVTELKTLSNGFDI